MLSSSRRLVNLASQSIQRRGLVSPSRRLNQENAKLAVICVLDGWGYNEAIENNAVLLGNTPNFDKLWGHHSQQHQTALLDASGLAVGVREGLIGNSEVGHTTIGSGRIVFQDICTIDMAIKNEELASRPALVDHINALKASGGTCHLMGLTSPGGVHSTQGHMAALANIVNKAGVPVVVHCFTDGRDVPPKGAANTLPEFEKSLDEGVKIATVTGRFYAMDRDNRWERVGQAYDVIVQGKGAAPNAPDAMAALSKAYADDQTDEFVLPTVIGDYEGMKDGDGILMANFRADRAREILLALADPSPPEEMGIGAERPNRPDIANVCGMVKYSERHQAYMDEIFPEKDIQEPIGEVIATHGLKQLRAAETEKYPHVTFFANGGREEPFENEDRILVPSPKVKTYDLQPSMSAPELAQKVCAALGTGEYNFCLVNFANPDMVGHCGVLSAAIEAVECVDKQLGELVETVKQQNGVIIVTADHGNCEVMWDGDKPHTAHTLSQVPAIFCDFTGSEKQLKIRNRGGLCDLAPTILDVMGIQKSKAMSGESLILKED